MEMEEYKIDQVSSRAPVFTIPYGIFSMSAYVTAHARQEIQTQFVDLNVEAMKICMAGKDFLAEAPMIIRERMTSFKPDIVGISALFNTCLNYLECISKAVKSNNRDVVLTIGGGLATNLYREVLENNPEIDAACYGEGELPILELVNADRQEEYLRTSSVWITRDSLAEGRRPSANLLYALDEIPILDYAKVDFDVYYGRAADKRYDQYKFRELSIHTSRGCPFDCIFCSNSKLHGRTVRFMSIDRVVAEVKHMVDEFRIEVLLIEDDHFLADKRRAKEILLRLADFSLRIEFPNGIAVYAIDDEIAYLLKRAGVTTISLAVESGSDFVLQEIINKPLKTAMVKRSVDALRKNDICVHAFFVVGLPGELEEHREETMRLIHEVGFDWSYFFLALPIAGSRLYELCRDKGYLVSSDFSGHITTRCNIRTPDMDPQYMEEKVYLMNLDANFINNYNFRTGAYEKALPYFKSVVKRYPDHAFAHYCYAKTLERICNENREARFHFNRFDQLLTNSVVWDRYARYFNIKRDSPISEKQHPDRSN